jgi:hypothetical protein
MPFNLQELQAGINYWHNTNWPQDFHNQFYIDIAAHNQIGLFTPHWWPEIFQRLRSWRATRPKSFEYINERTLERLGELHELWEEVNGLPDNITAMEIIVAVINFVNVIHTIKNVNSPVFTSKFSHFVSPKRFPVIDRRAMGLPLDSYVDYLHFVRQEWNNTGNEVGNQLINFFANELGHNVFEGYPFHTKIAEICLIGRNHG